MTLFFIQGKAQMQKTFHLDKMKRLLFDLISVNTSISVKKQAVSHKKQAAPHAVKSARGVAFVLIIISLYILNRKLSQSLNCINKIEIKFFISDQNKILR